MSGFSESASLSTAEKFITTAKTSFGLNLSAGRSAAKDRAYVKTCTDEKVIESFSSLGRDGGLLAVFWVPSGDLICK